MCIFLFTATFDIQYFIAEGNGDVIAVIGEFIAESIAKGCFIVLQCDETTVDTYRAIPWNGLEQRVSETIKVPSSTYTVYAYDIENDGLPHFMPANISEEIAITTDCKCCVVRLLYTLQKL